MNALRTSTLATLLGSLALAACSQPATTAPAGNAQTVPAEKGMISGAIDEAIVEARREIKEGNISVSSDGGRGTKAEITPQGDFLIDGRTVRITPEQRALLLEHRGHVAAVAEAGMQVGLEAADLATTAMKEAVVGALTGQGDRVEARVEAEASKIKTSALELCRHLPALMASQQKLAAALPEFQPYATMTQSDVDDCGNDLDTAAVPPPPPGAPTPPAPPAPPKGKGNASTGATAEDVFGKPELPELPELPDPTG